MAGMLEGKAVLITGGGGGIGRATALICAREGARVVAADISAERAQETVSLINANGGQALSASGDVTDAGHVASLIATAVKAYGRVDCAFNNAGIGPFQVGVGGKKTAEWPEDSFRRMIDVNLTSVWMCMRAEIEQMMKQGGGSIVNTASVAGLVGLETACGYVAAKHGVVGLTKTAALDYAQDGIRVNSVCPGYIETDMTKQTMIKRGDVVIERTPVGRMGQASEIAEMVAWLFSDRASFATGGNFNVDGGYFAR